MFVFVLGSPFQMRGEAWLFYFPL